MRRFLIVAVFAVAILGMLAPPVFAQAPAPKVTITGAFDQVTSGGQNFYDGNYSRNGDREWYSRVRFRPDFVFSVGRTSAVLGIEIDLMYGQTGICAGGPGKCYLAPGTSGLSAGTATNVYAPSGLGARSGTTGDIGLNSDVAGVLEVKWVYTEFDLTGKDSLLPFIPVLTVARAGAQPFGTLGNFRTDYATGDFAGVSAVTTFAPNLKTTLAYVIVEDSLAGLNRGGVNDTTGRASILNNTATGALNKTNNRGKDFAAIASAESTPIKGLDIKPVYSFFRAEGTTSGNARRNAGNALTLGGTRGDGGGGGMNGAGAFAGIIGCAAAAAAPVPGCSVAPPDGRENRHTVGIDMRWRSGPFSLDSTVLAQVGSHQTQALRPDTITNIDPYRVAWVEGYNSAWLIDVAGGWQAGPLLLEGRVIYSTGNDARDDLGKGIKYFEPLDLDTSFYAGWANILALGVDYYNGGGGQNGGMSTNVGYDRYGRAQFGVRATYAMTPALSFYSVVSPTWTAKQVSTVSSISTTTGARGYLADSNSFAKGDSSYLGTEADLGLTWRFAPNVAFDLVGAWLFAGSALDTAEIQNGVVVKKDAQDAWTSAARVRLSF